MSEFFKYTDAVDPVLGSGGVKSSAVECVYYNSGTKELLVGLVDSGVAYLYTGVPTHVFSAFKNSVSKGYFYAKVVKNTYGPADNFGKTNTIDFYENGSVWALPTRKASAGTPKGLHTTPTTTDSTSASVLAFPLKTEDKNTLSVVSGTAPAKAEVKFDDAVSTDVVFNLGGNDATTNFDVVTVSEAVAEITRIAEMLGLGEALLIKSVTVNFV